MLLTGGRHLRLLRLVLVPLLMVANPVFPQSVSIGEIHPLIDRMIERLARARTPVTGAPAMRTSTPSVLGVHIDATDRLQVYIHLNSPANDMGTRLADEFGFVTELYNEQLGILQGWIPYDQVRDLAALPEVTRVEPPAYATTRSGTVLTQGDAILLADQIRGFGIDGTGVRVGVISDGANERATSQASGNLPDDIVVYGNCQARAFDGPSCDPGWNCNEGTAMLEIIHDMAPGAELAMASVNTSLEFIQRLDDLVNDFGADVIVDDLGFLFEPFFADGELAQAVAAIANQVVYVSAAGNSAQTHYEAEYVNDDSEGIDVHDFGLAQGQSSDLTMNIAVPAGRFLVTILQWNDPYGSSFNDYDLYLFDSEAEDLRCPECFSIFSQEGAEDPLEAICFFNDTTQTAFADLVINRFSGSQRRMELFLLGGGAGEYVVPEGSVFGHAGIPDVLAVGAISAGDAGHNDIELFSSRGPARVDFPSLQLRLKPDVTGIDGVSVTGVGGFPSTFFGSSAAAPHVAAIGALLRQAAPEATPAMIRNAIKSGAVDLGSLGADQTFGYGRVNGLESLIALAPEVLIQDSDDDGIPDDQDSFPQDPTEWQDSDDDGIGDNADPDDDNDGMSDEFELRHALQVFNPADAGLDPDLDGYTNLQEFLQGRNPVINEGVIIQLLNSSD